MPRTELLGLGAVLSVLVAGMAIAATAPVALAKCTQEDQDADRCPTTTSPPPRTTSPPTTTPPPPLHPERSFYAMAVQTAYADGAWGWFTVTQPRVEATESHSLAAMVVDLDEINPGENLIQIGYTVDRSRNGDSLPHLFVNHWVDGVPGCSACVFVSAGTTTRPGMALAAGSSHQLAIRRGSGGWWLVDNGNGFGYFPDWIWRGQLTRTAEVSWMGEVTARTDAPCSDMGNGEFASSDTSAAITDVGYWNGPSVFLSPVQPTPNLYTVRTYGTNNLRFGGPGSNPGPVGICLGSPPINHP